MFLVSLNPHKAWRFLLPCRAIAQHHHAWPLDRGHVTFAEHSKFLGCDSINGSCLAISPSINVLRDNDIGIWQSYLAITLHLYITLTLLFIVPLSQQTARSRDRCCAASFAEPSLSPETGLSGPTGSVCTLITEPGISLPVAFPESLLGFPHGFSALFPIFQPGSSQLWANTFLHAKENHSPPMILAQWGMVIWHMLQGWSSFVPHGPPPPNFEMWGAPQLLHMTVHPRKAFLAMEAGESLSSLFIYLAGLWLLVFSSQRKRLLQLR